MLDPKGINLPGSYNELRQLMGARLRSAHLADHVFELVQAAFNSALAEEDLVLSAAEKRRLLKDVMKEVLEEMNRGLG